MQHDMTKTNLTYIMSNLPSIENEPTRATNQMQSQNMYIT